MDDETCPNDQLLSWVKEWFDVARDRNSKGITTYKNAYDSLKACPLTFQHPSELQQLRGFGPKICERLEEKLRKHCEENGLEMPEHPQAKKARDAAAAAENGEPTGESSKPKRKARQPKAYVPTYRSGAFALIVGLSGIAHDSTGMTKAELIEAAQPHCDSSFSAPSDPTKFYTAWSSMKTLLQKELVYEHGRPLRRYALTDEGWEVARRIRDSAEKAGGPAITINEPGLQASAGNQDEDSAQQSTQDIVAEGAAITDNDQLPVFSPIVLPPGSFTVELLLDVREVRAKKDRDYMQEELSKLGVDPIMRSLEVGDVQWVAKCKDPDFLSQQGAEGDEVVLDWIVERKRLDDLIGSIKDGRFHEQKFRLKRSGVQHVIYIIEEIAMDSASYSRYEDSVQTAIASTQAVNGYFVKRTLKMDDTIKYLTRLTKMLKRKYEQTELHVIPTTVLTAQNYLPLLTQAREQSPQTNYCITYPAFSSLGSKSETMTLRDVFLKMLMTTRGLTGERALEIQKKWKTPHDFVKAYESCGVGENGKKRKADLITSQLGHLVGRKKFTKALSVRIGEIWGDL